MSIKQAFVQFIVMAVLLTFFKYHIEPARSLTHIIRSAVVISIASVVAIGILQRTIFREKE